MSIALGVTWFEELANRPDIIDSVDFIEVAGWMLHPGFTRPHERLVLHNLDQDWSMAYPNAIGLDWPERLRTAIAETRTPWFSLHLGFAAEQVRFQHHMMPVSEPLDRDTLLERVVATTLQAREHCPLQILLENLDYCPEGAYEHVCEPGFIREVLERTGAGLLFDIGHWQVSASWLGFDPIAALDEIPMDRTVEIHVSSPRPLNGEAGRLDDTHEELIDRDVEVLAAVLERAAPHAITIEYRRDLDRLAAQVEQIRALPGVRAGITADLSR